jgi:hypothetical protein
MGQDHGMNMYVVKARRCARKWPKEAWAFFLAPVFNSGQILTFAAASIGLALILQTASPGERDVQASQWAVSVQAFAYAVTGWAIISMICAPFVTIKKDKSKGSWMGRRRIYHEPVLVGVSVFTDQDGDKVATVKFDDAEPNSLVSYVIELDPPVSERASCYLEGAPGQMEGILGSILSAKTGLPGKVGGQGSTRIAGMVAYLRVKLDAGTIPVTTRVYMTGFEVGSN